jgi:2-dehydro-3-deoxygluconokinase
MIELVEWPDGSLTRSFGGDTLNTAIYMARLGLSVEYVTALGDDRYSDEMVRSWMLEGICTETVIRVRDALPGLYLIRTDASGERTFSYWRDNSPVRRLFELPETPQIEAAIECCDLLYLSGITLSLFEEAARARVFHLIEKLRGRGGRIVFDSNFRPLRWPDRTAARIAYDRMLCLSDVVLASVEDFALLLSRDAAATDLIARFMASGVPECVIKMGRRGCLVAENGRTKLVRAELVSQVTDTTAAGDSFAAAYVAARCARLTPVEAARNGNRVAAAVIAHRGAIIPRSAMPPELVTGRV